MAANTTTAAKPMPRRLTPHEQFKAEQAAHHASAAAFVMPRSAAAAKAQADHDRLAQATQDGILSPDGVPSKSPTQAMLRQAARQGAAGPPPGWPPAPSTPRPTAKAKDVELNALLDRIEAELAAEAQRGGKPSRRSRR